MSSLPGMLLDALQDCAMYALRFETPSPVTAIAALVVISWIMYIGIRPYLRFGLPAPLPPGPPLEPFVGHWRKVPLENAHLKYMEDAEKYSV